MYRVFLKTQYPFIDTRYNERRDHPCSCFTTTLQVRHPGFAHHRQDVVSVAYFNAPVCGHQFVEETEGSGTALYSSSSSTVVLGCSAVQVYDRVVHAIARKSG